MTIREASRKIRRGELSPVELTQEVLANIARLQPHLNAYVTVTESFALEQARRAEREIQAGEYRGPLHGIPYAAKDLYYTQGIRTTIGSKLMADFLPDYDATVIQKLHAAGAVLVGKAGLHEWAYGITSTNPHFGAVRNPWDLDRIPGGSSGGSTAALASGQCLFSLGSDTGGSIRIPASLCGTVGLKPTFGRVSRHGVFPLSHTLDHAGVFGLTVCDTAWAYEAIAGVDDRDDSSVDRPNPVASLDGITRLDGKKVGVPRNFYFDQLDPDVDAAVRTALNKLETLGATMVDIEVPDIEEFNAVAILIQLAEATSVHRRRFQEHPEDFGDDVRMLIEQGYFVTATDYLDAQRRRRKLNSDFNTLLQQVDVIVAPTIPIVAAKIGQTTTTIGGIEGNVRLVTTRLVRALNLTGLPVLSVPCGMSSEGLPIGLQLIGSLFGEASLLEMGHAYEQATEWHTQRAPNLND
ncbi:MAG: Asp-tRNA(Asn)/Glu-tRNA(Gln) amidotransferase GatCAB subunit A [Solibacterales bacterium]|nr:Asp-tRNA(Asn)/Glu-tRNA(Gln) amidotransferase GatCAB subunit A [Bryobacterales bacterium]|tara:strand:- start:6992 stop:8389 length:1398 start_codon:yes stop_codon:yes gene_type:complete